MESIINQVLIGFVDFVGIRLIVITLFFMIQKSSKRIKGKIWKLINGNVLYAEKNLMIIKDGILEYVIIVIVNNG